MTNRKIIRFATLLKNIKTTRAFSCSELANRAGLDPRVIEELEEGKLVPDCDVLEKLEKDFGFKIHFECHKTVKVLVGTQEENIDEDIAPLIRELWNAGIDTFMSCQQDEYGFNWIQFQSEKDLVSLLNIVAVYDEGPDNLYYRMSHNQVFHENRIPDWQYDVHPEDYALETEFDSNWDVVSECHLGRADFGFFFSVRFPGEDFALVMERMEAHNQGVAPCSHDDLTDAAPNRPCDVTERL